MGYEVGRRRKTDAMFEVRKETVCPKGVSAEEATGLHGDREVDSVVVVG